MKRKHYSGILTGLLSVLLSVSLFAQLTDPGSSGFKKYKPHYQYGKYKLMNTAIKCKVGKISETSGQQPAKPTNPYVMKAATPNEALIGNTKYDLQSNASMQNRIWLWDDATLSATWTMGFDNPDFPDRGTGYNYYDGSAWGDAPTARIENTRTGWPMIAKFGASGELIVTHNGTSGLEITTRPQKGTGSWTQALFTGPTAAPELSWPRVVTNGPNKNTIHLFAVTTPVVNGGVLYNGQDAALVYSRSQDGGLTWDIKNVSMPETGIDYYLGLGGDTYSFAEPKGDTLALVVGDKWFDTFLLKSNDNGTTWTKTMIYQYPIPFYDEGSTIINDTIWVNDATMSVQLDKNGMANVFFGLMRVNNPDTTDSEFNYWPFTDGIAYWKEGMPAFTNLNTDTLYEQGHLVGWVQDVNGNDTVYDEMKPMPKYAFSLTSMPALTIDKQGDFYLLMSSEMEDHNNDLQNFRHILARRMDHATGEWGDFFDLDDNLIHNFHECIFPSISPTSDNFIHYVYQADDEPGLAVQGDEDPYNDNFIYYGKVYKPGFVGINEQPSLVNAISQNFPNPCIGKTQVNVSLNKAAELSMVVTDMLGNTVLRINKGAVAQGIHTFTLNVAHLTAGIYFYTVMANNEKT
ncbi:MAG: T9SS type A sorting domain-containing protein, partial [Bacteroidetes bacterium]|nr:T9SS type A sorting domain-containing protein [Bacteroidota bacterium]